MVHGGGAKIRTDLGKFKVFKILSETDVIIGQAAVRQPDTDSFRSWEVAADSHVDIQFRASSTALAKRDGNPIAQSSTAPAVPAAGQTTCEAPMFSHVPFYQVMDAAFEHLQAWVKDGKLPPTAPPIELSSSSPPAVIARDERGNSKSGGIRLAELEVPTGMNSGKNTGPGFCRLYGAHTDFDPATIAKLYPTHEAYVAKVKAVTEKNLKSGYILKPEADETIAAAEHSTIGR
jgi:hypothetical protein